MDAEQERWAEPLDLATLGELTARWLEGSGWSPWYGGSPPDSETDPLVSHLAALNRSGYLTDFSQPGAQHDWGSQRAAVTGYCAEDQAECLASIGLDSELVVIVHYPQVDTAYEVAITQEDGRTFTILPGRYKDDLWDGFHSRTASLLSECHFVAVCDPRWGREDLLWPSVLAALERDPRECKGSLGDPDSFVASE